MANKYDVSICPTAVTFETQEQAIAFANKCIEILHKEDGSPAFLYRVEEATWLDETPKETANTDTATEAKADEEAAA